jgi:glycosyltransferase involved in cell wall biosynthesis
VASSHPSLDEACGEAALRADPADPAAIAAAIAEAIERRAELAARGREHAAGFTWRAVGETFLRGYLEAYASRH